MITRVQLTNIGHAIKPHGINGEISATIDNQVNLALLRCIVMEIDGIYVPFFMSSMRPRGAEAVLMSIDGINNEMEAKQICGKTIYGLKEECEAMISEEGDDEGFYAEDLIGYKTFVDKNHELGEITDIDTSTDNTLFIITTNDDRQIFIPVVDEFILEIDTDTHHIFMSLPDGLLDL